MKRKINHIIIHCAATPNGKNIRAKDIDTMHGAPVYKNGMLVRKHLFQRDTQAARNFNPELKHIGYHYVITTDGHVEFGRGLEEVGAHVAGNNSKTIGICMIGTDKFTAEQWESLRTCIINLSSIIQNKPHATADGALNAFKDMGISIKGHRDYSPDLNGNGIVEQKEWIKTCPGFSVSDWIKSGMMPMKECLL
jgi:N-acetyl-anhydromuramyl-L-alanine amidase AmpD